MIANHKEDIDNVFVVINNEREAIADQFHFLNLSTETWELVGEFDNGGIPVGLYAWALNRVKVKFEDYSINYKELLAQK